MKLFHLFRSLFTANQTKGDMPYCIVMLLRSPFTMSKELLKMAASKAYGMPYDGSHEMYCVVSDTPITMLKAGDLMITILESKEPYLGDPVEVAKGFTNPLLTAAWIEHRTWVAFDLQNRDVPRKRAYASLAKLVANLLDARCAGIYLPKENQFTIESDGSAAKHLQSLALT